MKLLLLPLLTLLLLSSCKKDDPDPVPEPEPTFHSFQGDIGSNDNSTIITADNNLLICGNHLGNAVVLKISKTGSLIWQKDIDPGYYNYASGIAQSANQDIFICGFTEKNETENKFDVLLLKLNSNGDTLWTKTYGGSEDDYGYYITNTQDGNLLICGITYSFTQDVYSDIYLIKVNTDGDTLWTKTYNEEDEEMPYHVLQTQNGEYLVTGTNRDTASEKEVYLLKLSPDGTLVWNKKIGPATGKSGLSTVELSNGDLMTCGRTTKVDDDQILVVKTDNFGNVFWEQEYGEVSLDEKGNSMQINADGTLIITGSSESPLSGESGIILLKINQQGDQLLFKGFGYSIVSRGQNILKDDNDDNIITGTYNFNIVMTRTDNNGVFK